jgi:L-ascorbate metabolism protein UlaG (beta-lactamase superfamily)
MQTNRGCIVVLLVSLILQGCSIFDRDFSSKEKDFFTDYPAPEPREREAGEVKITYFGTSTLLFEDGDTKIMLDGYFSRPMLKQLLSIEPDEELIAKIIVEYELIDLAVILPVHSHHDHVMDAPIFAKLTNAKLLGTESSYLAGKELGLGKHQWKNANLNQEYSYGDFTITLYPARHGRLPRFLKSCLSEPNEIDEAIQYPANLCDYKESQSYSVHIAHKNSSFLIHPSTAYIDGTLTNVRANYVFLGIAGLSKLEPKEKKRYYEQTMGFAKGNQLIPIHWDDFMRSKNSKLYPPKRLMGSFEDDMTDLIRLNKESDKPAEIILLQKKDSILTVVNEEKSSK